MSIDISKFNPKIILKSIGKIAPSFLDNTIQKNYPDKGNEKKNKENCKPDIFSDIYLPDFFILTHEEFLLAKSSLKYS